MKTTYKFSYLNNNWAVSIDRGVNEIKINFYEDLSGKWRPMYKEDLKINILTELELQGLRKATVRYTDTDDEITGKIAFSLNKKIVIM